METYGHSLTEMEAHVTAVKVCVMMMTVKLCIMLLIMAATGLNRSLCSVIVQRLIMAATMEANYTLCSATIVV